MFRAIRLRRLASILISVPTLLLAAAILLAISCTPAWLPDSSGFLFVGGDGSVVRYTVATDKEDVVLPAGTIQQFSTIALRPDGKQFAWLSHDKEGERQSARFHIYTVDGESIHTSEPHRFTREKPERKPFGPDLSYTRCYWSPDGTKLLGVIPEAKACIVYDVNERSFTTVADASPFTNPLHPEPGLDMLFDISPVVPSGGGFLVSHTAEEASEPQLALVDWKVETVRPIELPAMAIEDEHKALRDQQEFGVLLPARWEMDTLAIAGQKGMLRIDAASRKARFAANEELTRIHDHARRRGVGVVGEFFGGNLLEATLKPTTGRKLQVWLREKKEPREICSLGENAFPIVSFSPNGRLCAVFILGQSESSRVVLVDSQGKLLFESEQKLLP